MPELAVKEAAFELVGEAAAVEWIAVGILALRTEGWGSGLSLVVN